jgi:N-acetyl-gamma-glutamyl-phosphate reductase
MKVFIDGRAGTTGLQIEERLRAIPGVTLLDIGGEERKDPNARAERLNAADAVFLCLPDEAATEAVSLIRNPDTVVFDASTAHRTSDGWAYGFPELSPEHKKEIELSKRIAIPGCHATGFCSIVYPLVRQKWIAPFKVLSCTSLTGYSGGGREMIAEYEGGGAPRGARPYALGLCHKHLPEMRAVSGLDTAPIFMPVVVPVRQGMLVSIPLPLYAPGVHATLKEWYHEPGNVTVMPFSGSECLEDGRLCMEGCNGTDGLQIFIFGQKLQTIAIARLDNLGKGAAGAAVQCFKLKFGL